MESSSSKLVTCLDGRKKLAKYCPIQGRVVIQNVRTEEEYMDHINKIIQRDYFPDLGTVDSGLKSQVDPKLSQRSDASVTSKLESRNPEKAEPTNASLDKYMANNTTEDDASFAELIEEAEKRRRFKMATFFPALEYVKKMSDAETKPLAITGGPEVQVGPRVTLGDSNMLHFNPDGVAQTPEEFSEHLAKANKILPSNTRFKRPIAPISDKRNSNKRSVLGLLGHIGLDGTESSSSILTPETAGFKFMDASPSPTLSLLRASPLMTWGELAATPSRLDDIGDRTPAVASGALAFRIPSPSKREQLAHKLADKASRQRLRNRNEAVKRVHSGVISPSARLLLSPAARLLLTNSSGSGRLNASRPSSGALSSRPGTSPTDFAKTTPVIGSRGRPPLVASTGTPRRLPSDLGVVRLRTTGERRRSTTPRVLPPTAVGAGQQRPCGDKQGSSLCSITDNLLNLTKPLHHPTGTTAAGQLDSPSQ